MTSALLTILAVITTWTTPIVDIQPAPGRYQVTAAIPMGPNQPIVEFDQRVHLSTDCTLPVTLRFSTDGEPAPDAEPLMSVYPADVGIDEIGGRLSWVLFERDLSAPGYYRIDFPEGLWACDFTPELITPHITLQYHIVQPMKVTPRNHGLTTSLGYWELRPVDCDTIEYVGGIDHLPMITDMDRGDEYPISIEPLTLSPQRGLLVRPLDAAGAPTTIDRPGSYSMVFPRGSFRYISRQDADPMESEEVILRVDIISLSPFEISPAVGEVSTFDTFDITIPHNYTYLVDNPTLRSPILYATGSVPTEKAIAFAYYDAALSDSNHLVLRVHDDQGNPASLDAPEGDYVLRLARDMVRLVDSDDEYPLPPFEYFYTVPSKDDGVEPHISEEMRVDAYTLDGILKYRDIDRHRLPYGLYILRSSTRTIPAKILR